MHSSRAGTCSGVFGTWPLARRSAQLALSAAAGGSARGGKVQASSNQAPGRRWRGRELADPRSRARAASRARGRASSTPPAPPTRRSRPAPGPRLKPGAAAAPRGPEGRSEHVQSCLAAAPSAGGWGSVLMPTADSASAPARSAPRARAAGREP